MIFVRNMASMDTPVPVSAAATTVPFDTVAAQTNGACSFDAADNAVVMAQPGRYQTACTVQVTTGSSAAAEVTLQLMSNGEEIAGDFVDLNIAASSSAPLTLSVPIHVETAGTSDAKLSWVITPSAAVSIENAFATVQRIV